jgi:hypothetical protein
MDFQCWSKMIAGWFTPVISRVLDGAYDVYFFCPIFCLLTFALHQWVSLSVPIVSNCFLVTGATPTFSYYSKMSISIVSSNLCGLGKIPASADPKTA